jgi:hypothetical protein
VRKAACVSLGAKAPPERHCSQAERARNWPSRNNVERKARAAYIVVTGSSRASLVACSSFAVAVRRQRSPPNGSHAASWTCWCGGEQGTGCCLHAAPGCLLLFLAQDVCISPPLSRLMTYVRRQADAKKRKLRLQSVLEQQRKLGHFEASRECGALPMEARDASHNKKHRVHKTGACSAAAGGCTAGPAAACCRCICKPVSSPALLCTQAKLLHPARQLLRAAPQPF